jgi:hypothetical protein
LHLLHFSLSLSLSLSLFACVTLFVADQSD